MSVYFFLTWTLVYCCVASRNPVINFRSTRSNLSTGLVYIRLDVYTFSGSEPEILYYGNVKSFGYSVCLLTMKLTCLLAYSCQLSRVYVAFFKKKNKKKKNLGRFAGE